MIFRRNRIRTPRLSSPESAEYIGITLTELEALEEVLLHGDTVRNRARPDIGPSRVRTDLIGSLYERAGAASVIQPDPEQVRIPFHRSSFFWLEGSIEDIELYRGSPAIAALGRRLLNRFRVLLGQARAVQHLGGVPTFTSTTPAPTHTGAPELT